MHGIIKIGDKAVDVVSNAATAFIFKQCFKEDLLTFLSTEQDDGISTEMMLKAFYIMKKQADIPEMSKLLKSDLSYESFIEFISGFEFLDTGSIALQTFAVWNQNAKTEESQNDEAQKKKRAQAEK